MSGENFEIDDYDNDDNDDIDIPIIDNSSNSEYRSYETIYRSYIDMKKYCEKNGLPFLTRSNEMEILLRLTQNKKNH